VAGTVAIALVLWTSVAHPLYGHAHIGQPLAATGADGIGASHAPSPSPVLPAHADHCVCHAPRISEALLTGWPVGGEASGFVAVTDSRCPRAFGRGLDHPPQVSA